MLTLIKKSNRTETYKAVAADALVKMLKSADFEGFVKEYRDNYIVNRARGTVLDNDYAYRQLNVPKVCFAAEWKKANRKLVMKSFNGLVLLEINNLCNTDKATDIRREASKIPYTYMTFVGLSGFSVKIVCKISCERGFDAQNQDQLMRFQHNAYKRLHYIYSSQLGLCVDNIEPRLDNSCMLSSDLDAYFNADAESFFVKENDIGVPEYKGTDSNVNRHIEFDGPEIMPMGTIYEWCYRDAVEKSRGQGCSDSTLDEAVLSHLADYCCESSLPVDYAIMHTCWKARFEKFGDDYIKQVFGNAYEEVEALSVPYAHVNRQALMAYKSEAFLKMHYELRRNVITGVVQYRRKNGFDYDFHNLTEQVMNTMTQNAIKQGIGSWDKDMRRIVNSDLVAAYDPISNFLYSLPSWDGKDRVAEFAERIPSECTDKEFYLHIWLLSMVAHWLGKDTLHGNALVPILIGGQGCGKTSFCSIILPPCLRDYYNDKVEFKNETSLALGLSSFALINIDEFDALKKSQQPTLKYLLSKSDIKLRLPYGKAFEQRRRYASFIATTNNPHPLVDRTGSRRFVCIQVTPGERIDFLSTVDYEQLYSQLCTEVYNGRQYWLDEEQTARLMEQNRAFLQIRTLAEILDMTFARPSLGDDMQVLTSYQIIDLITRRFPDFNITKGTQNEIGKYFSAHDFLCEKGKKGVKYSVKILE